MFEVARSLGMTVGEMVHRMSQVELDHWIALQEVYPSGEVRADFRMAVQTSALINARIPKGKPKTKPADFLVADILQDIALKEHPPARQKSRFNKAALFARLAKAAKLGQ